MITIYKYPFDTTDEFTISMPTGAKILSVQVQGENPCLWAQVNPSNPMKDRHFRVFGTGHPMPDYRLMRYVGTYQLAGGMLVFHLFEEMR